MVQDIRRGIDGVLLSDALCDLHMQCSQDLHRACILGLHGISLAVTPQAKQQKR